MPGSGSVLSNLKRQVNSRRGSGISGDVIDKTGTGKRIGFRGVLAINPEERKKMVLTGFSYFPDSTEDVGVMKKIARIGAGEDRLVLVYFDDRPLHRSLVFHPQAFLDHGLEEAKAEERQARGEHWLNLPKNWACTLRELADGDDTPRVQPTKQEEIERDGGWFHV